MSSFITRSIRRSSRFLRAKAGTAFSAS